MKWGKGKSGEKKQFRSALRRFDVFESCETKIIGTTHTRYYSNQYSISAVALCMQSRFSFAQPAKIFEK